MRRLADLGLDVYITEMDVLIQKPNFAAFAAPLLFDEAFRPKPAYHAIAELLNGR